MKKPLWIGSAYTEIVNYVDALPKGNEDFVPGKVEQRVRGSGYELAHVFNGFAFPYELIAPVGQGDYGNIVKETCRKENISLIEKEGINGCMYTFIDRQGEEGYLCVPGAEYAFDLDDMQYLNPDEISFVVLFGEMLTGPNAQDLIQALDDLQKPILFVPDSRGDDIEEEILTEVFQFEPELFLTDTEAYFLAGARTKDMAETASLLQQESSNTVFIYKQKEGMYYQQDDEPELIPSDRKVQFHMELAGYLAARNAGIDTHRSLLYATQFAEACRDALPDEGLMEMEKRKLAELILKK